MKPTQTEIMHPLLRAIHRHGGLIVWSNDGDEIERDLGKTFGLSDREMRETRENINGKGKRVWRNDIQWARKECVAKGWLNGSVRDSWSLTNAGKVEIGVNKP
jgi:Mrr N-terminal domain